MTGILSHMTTLEVLDTSGIIPMGKYQDKQMIWVEVNVSTPSTL